MMAHIGIKQMMNTGVKLKNTNFAKEIAYFYTA